MENNTKDFEVVNGELIKYNGDSHDINIPEGVTSIAEGVFKGLYWIKSIHLPETLKHIGNNAFKGCNQMTYINIPENVESVGAYAFHKCRSLEGIKFGDKIDKVDTCVFLACDNLKYFIGHGVKELHMQAFNSCINLSKVEFNKDIDYKTINADVFTGCMQIKEIGFSDGDKYSIENLVTEMGEIEDTSDLDNKHKTIKAIANNVYKILTVENGVLKRFGVNSKSVNIPNGITEIASGAFSGFKGILEIKFPDSLYEIGSKAFSNCIKLERVEFATDDIELSLTAFNGCTSLKKVYIRDIDREFTLDEISLNTKDIPELIFKIREQTLGDFLISGEVLVKYLGNNETVHIPKDISIIGKSAFEKNEQIKHIVFHSNINRMEERAFKGCTALTALEFIASNKKVYLYEKVFDGCINLIKFIRNNEDRKAIRLVYRGEFVYRNCKNLNMDDVDTLSVSDELMETIQKSNHANKMKAAEDEGKRVKHIKIVDDYQFCRRDNIKHLVVEDTYDKEKELKHIGKYAFSGCSSLETVEIKSKKCDLGEHAFEKCKNLKTIDLSCIYIPDYAFAYCENLETVNIHDDIVICDNAFAGCKKLKNINIDGEIVAIHKKAFYECESLERLPEKFMVGTVIGESAFERCTGLRELELNNVRLRDNTFKDCTNIEKVTIGQDVALHSTSFCGCTYINKINYNGIEYNINSIKDGFKSISNKYPDTVQNIISSIYSCFSLNTQYDILSYLADADKVKIPEGIYRIGDNAFRNHVRLKNIEFPSTLNVIGKLALYATGFIDDNKNNGLGAITVNNMIIHSGEIGEEIRISSDIHKVCSWSYAGETKIKTLILESSQTIVETYAFRNCNNLSKIIIESGELKGIYEFNSIKDLDRQYPEAIKQIFKDCYNCFKLDETKTKIIESTGNIVNLKIPNGILEINDKVYSNCNLLEQIETPESTKIIGKETFKESKWLRECNLRAVENIGDKAFADCLNLEKVYMPKLKTIGKRSFENCTSLREVELGGIEEISDKLFFGCKQLETIELPKSIKKIGSKAFAYCSNIKEIVYDGNIENIEIAKDAFQLASKVKWRTKK